uniref:CBS domain-containing protein n=1 Tax=Spongospora subterranea TaxID=70186 RepID=A0A0H5R2L1_9EUKA|eukprot:CRZ02124.1 hypothetical protein [Spongospora subterranea]
MSKRDEVCSALASLLKLYPATAPKSPSPQEMIIIPSSATLTQAFQTLIDNSILSAPVYNSETNTFIGFLDCRDLVAFCVFASNESNWEPSLEDMINLGAKATSVPVSNITASCLVWDPSILLGPFRTPLLFVCRSGQTSPVPLCVRH